MAQTVQEKPLNKEIKYKTSYVVGFALRETYDDLVTAQQMICNKRSPQESTNSISPTNSLKLIDNEHKYQANDSSEIFEENDEIESREKACTILNEIREVIPKSSSSKINVSKSINEEIYDSNTTLKQTGDTESQDKMIHFYESSAESEPEVKESKDLVDDDSTDTIENNEDIIENSVEDNQQVQNEYQPEDQNSNVVAPKIIYKKQSAIYSGSKLSGKSKVKRIKNVKNINFKYKPTKKFRKNQVGKIDCEVKNVLKNTNLFIGSDQGSIYKFSKFGDTSSRRIASFPLLQRKSLTSNSYILCHKGSTSSDVDDECSVETINSVIEIASKNVLPYKNDIVNVAVAVAFNKVKGNGKDDTYHDQLLENQLLTSKPFLKHDSTYLVSSPLSEEDNLSDATLVNKQSISEDTDSETFFMSKTSSEFNKYKDSTETFPDTYDSFDVNRLEAYEKIKLPHKEVNGTKNIFDTVINLNKAPVISTSASSSNHNKTVPVPNCFQNNVNINGACETNNIHNMMPNVLQKSTKDRNEAIVGNKFCLPNLVNIGSLIKEKETIETKCAVEAVHPTSFAEIWDKFAVALDAAVKKIEESIPDKIIKEINKSFANLTPVKTVRHQDVEMSGDFMMEEKTPEVVKSTVHEGLQCSLIRNKSIDKIMQKISSIKENQSKLFTAGPSNNLSSLSKLKPKILEELIDVLKPLSETPIVLGDDIENPVSDFSKTSMMRGNFFETVKYTLLVPLYFVRQNMFIITSVVMFFGVSLCFYGLIYLLVSTF